MTTIRKQAIDLIMNLSDSEIQQILPRKRKSVRS